MKTATRLNSISVANCTLVHADCLDFLPTIPAGTVELAFADPPFNIDRDYDVCDDNRPAEEYLAWSEAWIRLVHDALHPAGSFWIAIGDEFVSEIDVIAKKVGFFKRSHVVWMYTFGMACSRQFSRSHTHLLYYTKHKKRFTFNTIGDLVRVPSARAQVYDDPRANPAGKLPDNTWVLSTAELEATIHCDMDTWLESRICGTFKERQQWMDNQMPIKVMERILLSTSNPGGLVLDPFGGAFTTAAAAILTGRQFVGCELSRDYWRQAVQRIEKLQDGHVPNTRKRKTK